MRDDTVRWAPWFVVLWLIVVIVAAALMFVLSFKAWSIVAAIGLGGMELVGNLRSEDAFPPLTWVIRRWLPRWLAFTLIYGAVGGAGAYWFHIAQAERVAGIFALLGFLTAHFDVTYDKPVPTLSRRPVKRPGSPSADR